MKKSSPLGKRETAPGKSTSEQLLQFGEPPMLPGGLPTSRKFTRLFVPGRADTEGPPLPRGSLYDR